MSDCGARSASAESEAVLKQPRSRQAAGAPRIFDFVLANQYGFGYKLNVE
jgi:hypothetical protein